MDDVAQAAQTIGRFLQTFTLSGGLRLRYRVKLRSAKQSNGNNADGADSSASVDGAENDGPRTLYVEFTGPGDRCSHEYRGDALPTGLFVDDDILDPGACPSRHIEGHETQHAEEGSARVAHTRLFVPTWSLK